MGNKIMVSPEQLEAAAGKIESQVAEYRTLYGKLFGAVDSMQAAWSGPDNRAYTAEIGTFRPQFDAMSTLMTQYATFLRTSASQYRSAQTQTINAASKL